MESGKVTAPVTPEVMMGVVLAQAKEHSATRERTQVQALTEILLAGYQVRYIPSCTHGKGLLHRLFACRTHEFRPDIRVEKDGRSVAVNIKAVVLMWAVNEAIQNKKYVTLGSIICIPTDSEQEIPGSVLEYAAQNDIQICKVDKLNQTISGAFGG